MDVKIKLIPERESITPFKDEDNILHLNVLFIFSDKFPLLVKMFYSLDVWRKAKKLTKALYQVNMFVRERQPGFLLKWVKCSEMNGMILVLCDLCKHLLF